MQGSSTSYAAAASVANDAASMEQQVHSFICDAGPHGATDSELEEKLAMRHQTASARRRTLVLKGKVQDSGRKRATASGRQAVVWVGADLPPMQVEKKDPIMFEVRCWDKHVAALGIKMRPHPYKRGGSVTYLTTIQLARLCERVQLCFHNEDEVIAAVSPVLPTTD